MKITPLIFLNLIVLVAYAVMAFPDGIAAGAIVMVVSAIVLLLSNRYEGSDADFLIKIFLIGLFVRLSFGLLVHVFDLRDFFGGDANTYNRIAGKMADVWAGTAGNEIFNDRDLDRLAGGSRGMYYLVATIYFFLGKNILAAQAFCGTVGAAIAPVVYRCTIRLYQNRRVAAISAYFAAIFPAMVIWSGQLLKDGLVVFLLAFAMLMIIRLQKRFSAPEVVLLCLSMFGVVTLRFYIFYMLAVAVVGAFIVGSSKTRQNLMVRVAVLLMLGLGLTYLGVLRSASRGLERIDSLETVQVSRANLARDEAGFGEELDVSTTQGAIQAVPVGFAYLMFAPFPWQAASARQTFVLPEILIWWAAIPFLILGSVYSIRNKLRETVPIVLFTGMLTFAYSIFQGNIGTAYRQRTQIQVFLFIFIAVGITLFLEKRENAKLIQKAKRRRLEEAYRERERMRVEG